jgi:hypothetical protein
MDEDEFFETEEGQRWAAEFDRAGKAAARSMQKLAATCENLGLTLADLRHAREAQAGGACERVVASEISRILSSPPRPHAKPE